MCMIFYAICPLFHYLFLIIYMWSPHTTSSVAYYYLWANFPMLFSHCFAAHICVWSLCHLLHCVDHALVSFQYCIIGHMFVWSPCSDSTVLITFRSTHDLCFLWLCAYISPCHCSICFYHTHMHVRLFCLFMSMRFWLVLLWFSRDGACAKRFCLLSVEYVHVFACGYHDSTATFLILLYPYLRVNTFPFAVCLIHTDAYIHISVGNPVPYSFKEPAA